MPDTVPHDCVQPFVYHVKRIVVRCIMGEDDYRERDERIDIAVELGILTPIDAYALRCGESIL